MAGKNGYQSLADDFRERMASALALADEQLLADWKVPYPHLRAAMLGSRANNHVVLPYSLRVVRRPLELAVSIQTEQFDAVARYTGNCFAQVLETIDSDLQNSSGPWQMGWQSERRVKQSCTVT